MALFLAACSASGGSTATAGAGSGAPEASAAGGATVTASTSSTFGMVLAGGNGMTLYTYANDSAGTSTCSGGCATAWPPFTLPAGQQPTAGSGVTGALTTLTRTDGTIQVAYDGLPLYYWQGDAKPGDVTGDGVNGFSVARVAGGAPPPAPSSTGGRYGY